MVGGALGCGLVRRGRRRLLVGLLEWRQVVCDVDCTHRRQGSTALRPCCALTLQKCTRQY